MDNQPTYRKGNYYRTQLALTNSSGPVYSVVTNLAVLNVGTNFVIQTNINGNVYLPQNPEGFAYDADGNLTNDGRWAYTWDGENRLVKLTNNNTAGPQMGLTFGYDALSRRISKTVITSTNTNTLAFVYDGWNLVAKLSSNVVVRTYMWGKDLSGSLQGAGGIGGLLKVTCGSTNMFPVYDGHGNLASLIGATDGKLWATYEYGSFGELIRSTGICAKVNPFRFSTKYQDNETDLLYYGYRYYNQSAGNWLSRDPMEEDGGTPNLYLFAGNDPIDKMDDLGLAFYAIDGTWVNAELKANPWQLYKDRHEDISRYFRGVWDVGDNDSYSLARGVKNRICSDRCTERGVNMSINLTGWSRGAVIAVRVAQLLNDEGCDCGCGAINPIPVNWIGLFDAVAMTPGFWPRRVPPNVAHFYHAVKTSHRQFYFPTHYFKNEIAEKIYNEGSPHLTSHSDVGASILKKMKYGIINNSYPWIMNSAINSGVQF